MKMLDIEEHNARIFANNQDELSEIFDKGLASDSGETWIVSDNIIEALSENGYVLFKLDKSCLDDKID